MYQKGLGVEFKVINESTIEHDDNYTLDVLIARDELKDIELDMVRE